MTKLALFHQLTYSRWNSEQLSDISQRALKQSGVARKISNLDPLRRTFFEVIAVVEEEGMRMSSQGVELCYHNRAHVGDTINALGYLLSKTHTLGDDDRYLALIAMAGHDLYHQGKSNSQLKIPQEETTARLLEENCLYLLTPNQRKKVRAWVLGTNPDLVQKNHFTYRNQQKSANNLIQVLINESDIAASLNPALSIELTRSLLIERGKKDPSDEEIAKLYTAFTASCSISSAAGRSSIL